MEFEILFSKVQQIKIKMVKKIRAGRAICVVSETEMGCVPNGINLAGIIDRVEYEDPAGRHNICILEKKSGRLICRGHVSPDDHFINYQPITVLKIPKVKKGGPLMIEEYPFSLHASRVCRVTVQLQKNSNGRIRCDYYYKSDSFIAPSIPKNLAFPRVITGGPNHICVFDEFQGV
jgi:hypothetical protein